MTETLQKANFQAFIVGGAVRDLLLGIRPKDFDVATNARPEQVRALFRRAFLIGRRFQIVHVMFGCDVVEVTTFRSEDEKDVLKDTYGRVLRDNTFGQQYEDAARRDFTINAMYYDPTSQTVWDYHGGMADIYSKTLRIIGLPEERYREDPVRLLRIVRFAAKLGFTIEASAHTPIARMACLIHHLPRARLFDEILKLLTSGHAMACLQQLRQEGLHHGFFPLLDVVLEQPQGKRFIQIALDSTDQRVREEKRISPGFLFASLLWQQVWEKWMAYEASGEYRIPALYAAANEVLEAQTDQLAIQRRIVTDMRDIWSTQPRFEKRTGQAPYRLLEHNRFRAGYDFLLLRCQAGEVDTALGDWWKAFIEANYDDRAALIAQVNPPTTVSSKKRQRRRSSVAKKQISSAI